MLCWRELSTAATIWADSTPPLANTFPSRQNYSLILLVASGSKEVARLSVRGLNRKAEGWEESREQGGQEKRVQDVGPSIFSLLPREESSSCFSAFHAIPPYNPSHPPPKIQNQKTGSFYGSWGSQASWKGHRLPDKPLGLPF